MILKDMIISGLLKKGVINEVKDLEMEIDIPETNITVKIRAKEVITTMKSKEEA